MAPSAQRCGEEVAATLSKTVEPVPRPLARKGGAAHGDYASEGPFWGHRKFKPVTPGWVPFWGPQGGPYFGAALLFSVKTGGGKPEPFFASVSFRPTSLYTVCGMFPPPL